MTTSIDSLLKRAQRLSGIDTSILEEEWQNLCDLEVSTLLSDLEAKIAHMTPEEQAAEEEQAGPGFTPEEEATFSEWLEAAAEEGRIAWMHQQRKKRRRR